VSTFFIVKHKQNALHCTGWAKKGNPLRIFCLYFNKS